MKLLGGLLLAFLVWIMPAKALDPGAASFTAAQVTVAATATLVADIRPNRGLITITNLGATDVFCGGSGVTTSTGTLLVGVKGSSISIQARAAVYCIVAAATQAVSYVEVY